MKIKKVVLENFGVFGEYAEFDFIPSEAGVYNKPLYIIIGSNGAGKSTLFEALKIAFLGQDAFGIISKKEYQEKLQARIFRSENMFTHPEYASISVIVEVYDYEVGQKEIKITRSWSINKSRQIGLKLNVWLDGRPLFFSDEEKEIFIRDWIYPELINAFFYDGERLNQLTQTPGAIWNVFSLVTGLRNVMQAQQDIKFYLMTKNKEDKTYREIVETQEKIGKLDKEIHDIILTIKTYEKQQLEKLHRIKEIEYNLKIEGWISDDEYNEIQNDISILKNEIESIRSSIKDFFENLGPFVLCKRLLDVLEKRLKKEVESVRAKHTLELLEHIQNIPDFWQGIKSDEAIRWFERLKSYVCALSNNRVVHAISDEEREWLLEVIHEINNLPDIRESFERLHTLKDLLEQKIKILNNRPRLEQVDHLLKEKNLLEKDVLIIYQEIDHLRKKIIELEHQKKKLQLMIQDREKSLLKEARKQRGYALADKTLRALHEYENRLRRLKVEEFISHFKECLILLSQKNELVDLVSFKEESLDIVFHRQLSAGEQQLVATSVMWALKKLAPVSFPVVIDTPLARLDKEHRSRIASIYYLNASDQVILLTTNGEMTEDLWEILAPATAKSYLIEYNSDFGKSFVHILEPEKVFVS